MTEPLGSAAHGWSSDFPVFRASSATEIKESLLAFMGSASGEQIRAWDESIPPLQREIGEVIARDHAAAGYSAILEYTLPMEYRRPDVVLLLNGSVVVLELKGKRYVEQADLDQVAAYARDLRAYHRECRGREVKPVLVLMRSGGRMGTFGGVDVVGPEVVDEIATRLTLQHPSDEPVSTGSFLDADAYQPLPSLVEAARELMESGTLRRIHRAAAATEPALESLTAIAKEAARTKSRHLVLVTGLPGSGKTLVGLQLAHARFLDDLAVPRSAGRPTAPAVFLSGNGPLVEVLQYELRGAGGDGKTFVRDVKAYVARYSNNRSLVPPEHVLIFDEAQRAFDAGQVAAKHNGGGDGKSEPEHFVEFAERVPEWCVVVGLIGTGQEIHVGEEAGLGQWSKAVQGGREHWTVHVSDTVAKDFAEYDDVVVDGELQLATELRFHLTTDVHTFVEGLLGERPGLHLPNLAAELDRQAYHFRITRDLTTAKHYLKLRYAEDPQARFGMVASARDRLLERYGVPNGWDATKRVRNGPWFGVDYRSDPEGRSCRHLRECVTEFGCQGLELDATLLAWGNDLVREQGRWSNRHARNYQRASAVRDAFRLRLNAYRVLLTRGRDATVVFVPDVPVLDETYSYLVASGFTVLDEAWRDPD